MMWGLEAMAITFVAPHSLHARPLVVPRGPDLTRDEPDRRAAVTVLVDGKSVGELGRAPDSPSVASATRRRSLAVLPEVTFFTRYHYVFP